MTTVASDGRFVASDSMITTCGGKERGSRSESKILARDGFTFGIAGAVDRLPELVEWWLGPRTVETYPRAFGCDWSFVVFFQDGVWAYDEEGAVGYKNFYPVAYGTGRFYAMGALHAGCPAGRAVEIACKLDTSSALPVHVLPVSEQHMTAHEPVRKPQAEPAKVRRTRRKR